MNKAVFIDKDGTLIKDVPYNVNAGLVCLEESAAEALCLLKEEKFFLIVISNQSGVAQGFFKEHQLEKINNEIQRQLLLKQVQVDAFYYCPHLPGGTIEKYSIDCDCRKPKPGLILKAANDYDITIRQSWMIGDILNDVEAGNEAGCKSILLDNGNETEWLLSDKRRPDFKVSNLMQAAEIIIKQEKIKEGTYDKFLAWL